MFEKWKLILRNSLIFSGLSENELESVLQCLSPKIVQYRKDDKIVMESEKITDIYLILSGGVFIVKETISGDLYIISILHPSDVFGEATVFSRTQQCAANIQANQDSVIMQIDADKIIRANENRCPAHTKLIMNCTRVLASKFVILNEKVSYLTIKNVRSKLCRYLSELYRKNGRKTVILPLNRNKLAEYLNVARPALSRELTRLKDERVLDYKKNCVTLIDLTKLDEFSRI